MRIVVALALVDAQGHVLVQRRPAHSEHAGLWEFPGGKVEPGEGLEAALVREIAEELGLTIDPDALVPLGFAGTGRCDGPTPSSLAIVLFGTREWRGAITATAAQEWRFVAPDQIEALPMPELDYPLARQLCDALAGKAF